MEKLTSRKHILRLLFLGLLIGILDPDKTLAQDQPKVVTDVQERIEADEVSKLEKQSKCVKESNCEKEKAIGVVQQPVQPSPRPQATPTASDLASQVNNPAAPVRFVQFRNVLFPNIPGVGGVTNSLEIQPVIPILPSRKLPFLQLIKMTLPINSIPSPVNRKGLGDLQFFDLVSIKQSWGQWGFGPALVFPTATSKALGAGKWQAGPSFALIYTKVKNLTAGAVLQNPISFAGDSSRPAVNSLIITPTFTYNLPGHLVPGYWKHGWFVGLSDFDFTFNWRDGGAGTIPVGPQVGRVFHVGKQAFSASIEAGGVIKRPANTPNPGLILGFEFSVIFKSHKH